LNRYLRFILELVLIVFTILLIYISTIDLFIFNRVFLETEYISWLFYLLPVLLSFLFIAISIFLTKRFRLPKLIFITLSNIYLALSIFMITGVYCEEEKNLGIAHILIVLLISMVIVGIQFKKLLPSISKSDRLLVGLSTLIILAELYFNLFSYDLFYVNLMNYFDSFW